MSPPNQMVPVRDEFRDAVSDDLRGRATPEQTRMLQESDESCRRWVKTLNLLISETESDIQIRDRQTEPYRESMLPVDRERYATHLKWKRGASKFASTCRERVLYAEEVLRKVSGLSETADRLLKKAATLITDRAWLVEMRDYEIRKFGQFPELPTTSSTTEEEPK